jgi:hypothetical protein
MPLFFIFIIFGHYAKIQDLALHASSQCCRLGCTKKFNNMCWQLFPILLEPLSKNMPLKRFSDHDISNM